MSDVALHARPEVHQRRWFLLKVLYLSLMIVVMAVSSLNVALPTLQGQLGASATMIQWIVDSYALVFAGLLLTAGALGDRFGRKRALLFGLALFGAGSLISGLAGSADIVIVGRAVQGAGAAFVMPATLSLITAIFPPEERQRAIAIWVGFALTAGLVWMAGLVFLLLAAEYHAIVRWEEALIESRHGPAYRDYLSSVPRWLPAFNRRARRERGKQPGSASSATSAVPFNWRETLFSERGTLIAIAIGFVLLSLKASL